MNNHDLPCNDYLVYDIVQYINLIYLIGGLGFEWRRRMSEGKNFRQKGLGEVKQKGFGDKRDHDKKGLRKRKGLP